MMKPKAPKPCKLFTMVIVIVALSFSATAVAAECFEQSAFWRFEEQVPPFTDAINPGDALNGTCIDAASCPESVPGRFGSALNFFKNADGTGGSGINVAASLQGDILFDWAARDSFSIEFWMKRTTAELPRNEVIIGRDRRDVTPDVPDEMHWWLGVEAPQGTAHARFDVRPWSIWSGSNRDVRGKNNHNLIGTKVINDNAWHHIVFVRDARVSENRLYVDGLLDAKSTAIYEDSADYLSFASKESSLNIGWMNLSEGYHYQGLLDELALYDHALPAWYVEQRYLTDERVDPCD